MPGRRVSVGWSKLCHSMELSVDERRMKFPVLSSMASAKEELMLLLLFVLQKTRPLLLDRTRFELLVMARFAEEISVIGAARLATHTTVHSGMPLYHMPT